PTARSYQTIDHKGLARFWRIAWRSERCYRCVAGRGWTPKRAYATIAKSCKRSGFVCEAGLRECLHRWCGPWSSKPVDGLKKAVSGFDSHTLPLKDFTFGRRQCLLRINFASVRSLLNSDVRATIRLWSSDNEPALKRWTLAKR